MYLVSVDPMNRSKESTVSILSTFKGGICTGSNLLTI
jgi:hypothetical protein